MKTDWDGIAFVFLTVVIVVSVLAIVRIAVKEVNPYYLSQKADSLRMELNPVCADTLLREPGGLRGITAIVCYNEQGWDRINVGHLNSEQYERLIKPLDDRVRELAREKGIYRGRYYDE